MFFLSVFIFKQIHDRKKKQKKTSIIKNKYDLFTFSDDEMFA